MFRYYFALIACILMVTGPVVRTQLATGTIAVAGQVTRWGAAHRASANSNMVVLHIFTGTNGDGSIPSASLIADASGNLYSTTVYGGTGKNCNSGCGTIFQLSPPPIGQTNWTETVLYSFTGASGDGANPEASLIHDSSGALYGTTAAGGNGFGTVFKLSPPAPGQTNWTETVLHTFDESDGADPTGSLIADAAGNLYGTTRFGGTTNAGTVFELVPPAPGQTLWTENVLHSFNRHCHPHADGILPSSALIFDSGGALYGTTISGCGMNGNGTVFRVSPPTKHENVWTENLIYKFNGQQSGIPVASLIRDTSGAVYGTTQGFFARSSGIVFKLSPPARSHLNATTVPWTEQTLAAPSFHPSANLIADSKGDLYSTNYGTYYPGSTNIWGTVFELIPPTPQNPNWQQDVLYAFGPAGKSNPFGAHPSAGLLFDNSGDLFGTTTGGGGSPNCPTRRDPNAGCGTVFELIGPFSQTQRRR